MNGCPCGSVDVAPLVLRRLIHLTELPGELEVSLFQCQKCGALVGESHEDEEEKGE